MSTCSCSWATLACSFWALRLAIIRHGAQFDVSIIGRLLLLGSEVKAQLIEEFVAMRTETEREQLRTLLLEVEALSHSEPLYYQQLRTLGRPASIPVIVFPEFAAGIAELMSELRRGGFWRMRQV